MKKSGLVSLIGISLITFLLLGLTIGFGNSPLLGIDLQGGVSVVLDPVEGQDITDEKLEEAADIIRRRIDSLGVAEPEVTRRGKSVSIQLPGVDDQQRAIELVGQTGKLEFRPVLTLAPFLSIVSCSERVVDTRGLIFVGNSGAEIAQEKTEQEIAAINSQLDEAISEYDDTGEKLSIPGCENGQPTNLPDDLPEDLETTTTTTSPTTTTTTSTTSTTDPSTTETTTSTEAVPPTDTTTPDTGEPETPPIEPEISPPPAPSAYNEYIAKRGNVLTDPKTAEAEDTVFYYQAISPDISVKHLLGPSNVGGEALESARAVLSGINTWTVSIVFKAGEEGIDKFNAVAQQCAGNQLTCPTRRLAIALDGIVESAPEVQTNRFERDMVSITGNFTEREARDLALVLRSGALPLEFKDSRVSTVSATLGNDSLRAGIIAGIIGISLVAAYMIFYYRSVGLLAMLSLAISALLLWVIISFLSETQGLALTIAGVTGLIVSIGVSLDSNVVYFENLKEDLSNGKTLRSASTQSFPVAFKTIFWANLATLIGAIILWWLATGPVKGFAAILIMSSVLDLVATYFFLRPAVKILAHSKFIIRRPRWLIGIKDNAPTAGAQETKIAQT